MIQAVVKTVDRPERADEPPAAASDTAPDIKPTPAATASAGAATASPVRAATAPDKPPRTPPEKPVNTADGVGPEAARPAPRPPQAGLFDAEVQNEGAGNTPERATETPASAKPTDRPSD
jgi:hypothetical protein